jgi:hypothetical protein
MEEREIFKKDIDLRKLYKERDRINKDIADLEMVLEGDGIWCSRCGDFVPITKTNLAYKPDHAKDGYCYYCSRLLEKCENRDRLLNLIGGSTIIDLKPLTDDGDYIEWIMFKSPDGETWKFDYREGKLYNLRHILIKERGR